MLCDISWIERIGSYFIVICIDESVYSGKLLFTTLMQNYQTDFIVGGTHQLVNIRNEIIPSLLSDSQIEAVESLSQLTEAVHPDVVMAVEYFSTLFFVGHCMGLDFSKDADSAYLLFHAPSKQHLDCDVDNALVFKGVGS